MLQVLSFVCHNIHKESVRFEIFSVNYLNFFIFCLGGAPDTLTDLPKLYKNGFKGCIFKFRVEMKKVYCSAELCKVTYLEQ